MSKTLLVIGPKLPGKVVLDGLKVFPESRIGKRAVLNAFV